MCKRKKNRKSEMEQRNCYNCGHCVYIGEGDYICDMSHGIVMEDWIPADDFYSCEGKDYEAI